MRYYKKGIYRIIKRFILLYAKVKKQYIKYKKTKLIIISELNLKLRKIMMEKLI